MGDENTTDDKVTDEEVTDEEVTDEETTDEETTDEEFTDDKVTDQEAITSIRMLDADTDLGGRSDWGNKLVVNTGANPVINFAFMLRVEGVFDLPCKAVKGIQRENEFDYIQEGGLNDYVHLKRKAITKPNTFQVQRYVGVNWVDPMPLGTELLLPLILFVNNRTFPDFKPVRNYVFTGCTVIAKDYGELNAEVSGLLVETVTIAYREMVCLDIPNDTLSSDNVWKFKEKSKNGEGDRHYNSNFFNSDWESSYSSKEEMNERANSKAYKHSKTPNQYASAKHNLSEKEPSKDKMLANAKLWPTEDEEGNIPRYGKDYGTYVTDFNKQFDDALKNAQTEEEREEIKKKMIATDGHSTKAYKHSETPNQYASAKHNTAGKEFSKDKMKENAKKYDHSGKKNGSAKHNPSKKELPKDKMKENAKMYNHSGKNNGSAKHNPSKKELPKDKMIENAKMYNHSGENNGSAQHNPDRKELSKGNMAEKARLWPKESSGTQQPMRTPEPRLWPKVRSAREITDFLKKH